MWALISLFLLQAAPAEAPPVEAPVYECTRLNLMDDAHWRCRFEERDYPACNATVEERDTLRIACHTNERWVTPQRSARELDAQQTISSLACPELPRWSRTLWLCRSDDFEVQCVHDRRGGSETMRCATESFLRNENREVREEEMQWRDMPRR